MDALLSNLSKTYGGQREMVESMSSKKMTATSAAVSMQSQSSDKSNSKDLRKQGSSILHREKKQPSASSSSMKKQPIIAMDTILTAMGCVPTSNARRYFTDVLDGKSIVLSNTNRQVSAATTSHRNAAQLRRKKMRASNVALKSAGLLDPMNMKLSLSDLQNAHNLWQKFIITTMGTCTSDAQLQARFNAAGLLGARVTLVRTIIEVNGKKHEETPMITGFVCNESKNCIYIAYIDIIEQQGNNSDSNRSTDDMLPTKKRKRLEGMNKDKLKAQDELQCESSTNMVHIFRAIRKLSEIAVPLPPVQSPSSITSKKESNQPTSITTAKRVIVMRGAGIL